MNETTHKVRPFGNPDYALLNQNEITPSKLFGELVQLVVPHLKRYHSDLYWDAEFIQEHCEPGSTFYYGVAGGGYGTHISTNRDLIYRYCSHLWEVTVPTGKADVTITLVKEPE